MFSLTLMSKGEKRCVMDATVGDLSRTMQYFRVGINAKGGDCWQVYRQSVIVIDGKNNNDDGIITSRMCNGDKHEINNDSIENDDTMRNCCLQA
jgi:hypothetical protein